MDATNTTSNDTHAPFHAVSTATAPPMTVPVRRPSPSPAVDAATPSSSAAADHTNNNSTASSDADEARSSVRDSLSPGDPQSPLSSSSNAPSSTPGSPSTADSINPSTPSTALTTASTTSTATSPTAQPSSSPQTVSSSSAATVTDTSHNEPLTRKSSADSFQIPPTTRYQFRFPALIERCFAPLDDALIAVCQRSTVGLALLFSTSFTFFTAIEISLVFPTTLFALGYDSAAGLCTSVLFMLSFISQIPKKFIFRPRPWMVKRARPIRRDKTSSFPSRAVVCAVIFSWLMAQSLAREGAVSTPVNPIILWFAILIVAALTAFARINVGAHYPSDTIFGFLLGCAVLKVGLHVELMWSSACDPQHTYTPQYHDNMLHPANSSLLLSAPQHRMSSMSDGVQTHASFSFPSAAAANASMSTSHSNQSSSESTTSSSSSLTNDSVASSASVRKAEDENNSADDKTSSSSSSTHTSSSSSSDPPISQDPSSSTDTRKRTSHNTTVFQALFYILRKMSLRRPFVVVTLASYVITLISIQGFWVKCSYVYGLLLSAAAFRASLVCSPSSDLTKLNSAITTSSAHMNQHQDIISTIGQRGSILNHIKAATPFTMLLLFGMGTRGKKGRFRIVSFTIIYFGALIAMLTWRLQSNHLEVVDG